MNTGSVPPADPEAQHIGNKDTVATEQHPAAVPIIVLALLGATPCLFFLGPVAWVMANRALREINASPGRYSNRKSVTVGRTLAIVGTLLAAALIILLGALSLFVWGVSSSSDSSGPTRGPGTSVQNTSPTDDGSSASQATETSLKVTVPEGSTVDNLVDRAVAAVPWFSRERFRAALSGSSVTSALQPEGQPSFEGLLFPASVEVKPGTTEAAFLNDLAHQMDQRVATLEPADARARIKAAYGLDLSTYDMLNVASLVQISALNPDEMPKVAAVIYNRLQKQIPLGLDAADNYGANLAGTEVDFNDQSLPYNTRSRFGLPATPISAPSESALSAAFTPDSGSWLYFVPDSAQSNTFLTTYAEFLDARLACKQAGLGCG